jgi:tRNA C32,U32 (ribose-2'-O)-methylase TrmJ
VEETLRPRVGLVAHGGESIDLLEGAATVCLGAEREGLPAEVAEACDVRVTIPLREGAESLNVAAAAAIALHRISSPGVDASHPRGARVLRRSNPSDAGAGGEGTMGDG